MTFTVYILYSCKTKKFYAGQTDSLDLRLTRHNQGLVKSTKPGIPWLIVWTMVVSSRSEALLLEKKIKKRGISRFIDDLNFNWKSIIGV